MPTYQPFEELRAEVIHDENVVRLSTPWTKIEAKFPLDMTEKVSAFCREINLPGTASNNSLSEFLHIFKDHYVAYLMPRVLPLQPSQCSSTKTAIRERLATPEEWIHAFAPVVAHNIQLTGSQWQLDCEALLAQSRVPGTDTFDAASAYRVIMRWALKAITESLVAQTDASLFKFLEAALASDEAVFFDTAKYYIRQYHYVTSNSFECLTPAIESMPFARELVHHLAHEEYGHGSFTASSLKHLGLETPTSIPLGPHVVAIMDFLRAAAHLNPLAFSCLFNLFELPGEQRQDPIAALLRRSSRPMAANGLDAHFKLNKDGAHFTNGFFLVSEMQAVDEYTVIEAARFAELHLMLHNCLGKEIIAYGNRIAAGTGQRTQPVGDI